MSAVHCPICKRFLGTVASDGTFDTLCPPCGRRTKVLRGRVNWMEMAKVKQHSKTKEKEAPITSYELRIKDGIGRTHATSIEVKGENNPLRLTKGDKVSIMWVEQTLFSVQNDTNGQLIKTGKVPWSTKQKWFYGGFAAAGVVVFVGNGLQLPPLLLLIISIGTIVTFWKIGERMAERNKRASRSLVARQELLLRIHELNGKKAEVEEEMRKAAETAKKLFSLREKMESLGDAMYKNRRSVVEQALRQIARMRESQGRLIDEYGKAIAILEIECEIHDASHSIDAVGEDFFTQMERVKAVEESVTALRCQVEANDEVVGLWR